MSTKSTKRADLGKRILAVNLNEHSGAFLVGSLSGIIEDELNPLPLPIAERITAALERAAAWGKEAEARHAASLRAAEAGGA